MTNSKTPISKIQLLSFFFLLALLSSCNKQKDTGQSIYFNGNILTMEDDQRQVEAVLVKAGKIVGLGNADSIQKWQEESVEMVDLKGKTMLPGFIDAHSHFAIASSMMQQANVSSPPAGEVQNLIEMVETLKKHQEKNETPDGEWIVGWGYDPDLLAEKRHPNKLDLDATFPNHPVFLLHVSAHMVVLNSKALTMLGITDTTKAPKGGVIVRLPDSQEPSGLLQEKMVEEVIKVLPRPSATQSLKLLEKAQDFYASRGITTAQDGLTDLPIFKALEKAAMLGYFTIDLEVLGNYRQADEWLENYKDKFGKNYKGLRLAGIKIVGDGSPQGKTAFFSKPYLTHVPGCAHTCRGVPTVTETELDHILENAYRDDIQIYMHANGDSSIDMLLDTHEAAIGKMEGKTDDLRTVVIHSQFVRPDQLQKYKQYGFIPAYFTNHAFFWGDVHLENLGEERASFLSPMKTSMDMGIVCTNHTDFIVTPLNQLFLTWTAVNRTTRSGIVLGEAERLSPWEALKCITINAAFQHKTEKVKGSIAVGKLADFVVLSDNPLTIDPMKIKDIEVLKTIKEGIVIFSDDSSNNE